MDEFDALCLNELLTPQMSTTRPKRHIKIEKPDYDRIIYFTT